MADNKKMKTLGGYEIVDEKAREDILTVSEKADEALSLAKGATKAFVYDTYSDMITELNALDKTELLVNFHVMIRTVCVPDLWISGVSDEYVEYIYTSNEDFITDLTEDGVVQVGYFVLSALETQKVELDDYVKKDDFATKDKVGLVYANPVRGINVLADGGLIIAPASEASIDSRSVYLPITGKMLDYSVMKALTDPKNHEWTEEQKQLARELLGSVGFNDYATTDGTGAGIVKAYPIGGIDVTGQGQLYINKASKDVIDKRDSTGMAHYQPIVPLMLDYAVKKALSDCKLEGDDVWTEDEKASVKALLGLIGESDFATQGDVKIKTNNTRFLTSKNIDLIVKQGLANCQLRGVNAWTDEEKASALELLGAVNVTNVKVGEVANSIAKRGVGGTLSVGTPTADTHATTKKYVDDGFVAQLSYESDDTHLKGLAYIVDKNNEQSSVEVRVNAIGDSVPVRDKSGNMFTQMPTDNYHVANKKYVDERVGSVETILTELHSYAQTKIGGEA